MATSENSDREYCDQEMVIEAFYQNVKDSIVMIEPPEGMNPCVKEKLLKTLGNSKRREMKKKCDEELKTCDDGRTHRSRPKKGFYTTLANIVRENKESREEKLDKKSLRELREKPLSPYVPNPKRRKKGASHWDYMC